MNNELQQQLGAALAHLPENAERADYSIDYHTGGVWQRGVGRNSKRFVLEDVAKAWARGDKTRVRWRNKIVAVYDPAKAPPKASASSASSTPGELSRMIDSNSPPTLHMQFGADRAPLLAMRVRVMLDGVAAEYTFAADGGRVVKHTAFLEGERWRAVYDGQAWRWDVLEALAAEGAQLHT